MTRTAALLATSDDALLDDALRLAAAAGVTLDVAHDTTSALRAWTSSRVVLVGADQADLLAQRRPPRREHVHVLTRGPGPPGLFRTALEIGAQDVVELPAAERWMVELLTDLEDGAGGNAVTIGVVGGAGGAGATVVAAALAVTASRRMRGTLVDLDRFGPGADRVLGMTESAGVRWERLLESAGRFGARSLRDALPRRDRLSVLTWEAAPTPSIDPLIVREVLSATRRGNDAVVIDLPRHLDEAETEAVTACDHVLLVSRLSLPAIASASRIALQLRQVSPSVLLVTRGPSAGLPPERAAEILDLPLLASVPDERRLLEHLEIGLGPVHSRRSRLARVAREIMDRLASSAPVVA